MVKIRDEWFGKKVRVMAINNRIFTGVVDTITSAKDDPKNHDSITIENSNGLFILYDNEIKDIEILD